MNLDRRFLELQAAISERIKIVTLIGAYSEMKFLEVILKELQSIALELSALKGNQDLETMLQQRRDHVQIMELLAPMVHRYESAQARK